MSNPFEKVLETAYTDTKQVVCLAGLGKEVMSICDEVVTTWVRRLSPSGSKFQGVN